MGWRVMVAAVALTVTAAAQQAGGAVQAPVHDDAAVTLKGAPDGQQHPWTREQLLTSSVHDAWVLSGRNEDQFFEMVRELAALSAEKRGLKLPDTDAAGKKAGELIKQQAKKDPDQLLYVVVDEAVRKTAMKSAAAAAQASTMR